VWTSSAYAIIPTTNRAARIRNTLCFFACAAVVLLSVIFAPVCARADGCVDNSQWINTNRPIQTTSAEVVPTGSLQIENGTIWNVGQGSKAIDGPETFVRFGVYHCFELQFVAPNYFHTIKGSAPSGFSDSAISSEYQFGALADRYQLSLVTALGLPTGDRNIAGSGWNPYFQLPWQITLIDPWSVSGMFSFVWYTAHSSENPTFEPTFALGRSFAGNHGTVTAEYAGIYDHQQPSQILDGYVQWRPNMHQQVDLESGFGLNRSSPDHFLGVGYSFRFDDVLEHLIPRN
jgi:hypothetical protein